MLTVAFHIIPAHVSGTEEDDGVIFFQKAFQFDLPLEIVCRGSGQRQELGPEQWGKRGGGICKIQYQITVKINGPQAPDKTEPVCPRLSLIRGGEGQERGFLLSAAVPEDNPFEPAAEGYCKFLHILAAERGDAGVKAEGEDRAV